MICQKQDLNNCSNQTPVRPRLVSYSGKSRRSTRRVSPVKIAERFLFAVAAASLIWYGAVSTFQSVAAYDGPTTQAQVATMTVAPGDTLWTIARSLRSTESTQQDLVNEIRELNPKLLNSPFLAEGETLIVPISVRQAQSDLHLAKAITDTKPTM